MRPSGEAASEVLDRLREERGEARPRIGLFLFGPIDIARLGDLLQRIPAAAAAWLDEVVVMAEASGDPGPPLGAGFDEKPPTSIPVRLHRTPRSRGYGGARKAAFEYARNARIDHVITMRGDGSHAPEQLPALLVAAIESPRQLVVGVGSGGLRSGTGPLATRFSRHLARRIQQRILGLRDIGSSYRIYPTAALTRLPYQLDSNDELFELEMIIQFRALGSRAVEVELSPSPVESPLGGGEDLRACATAVAYRLHQLHIIQDGRFLVEHDVRYTFKRSETGSHMQIVEAIRAGSRVLDLGCSQGLLAAPLAEKNVSVVGVDHRPAGDFAEQLEGYFERDLDEPLDLPVGRHFDYVVIADVIEHLRNRQQLLRGARRFLKEDGRLIISTGNVAIWFYRFALFVGRFEYGPRGILDETHLHLYTGASFRREVERAGFQVLERRVTALPFEVVFESTGRSRLMLRIASLYHGLARAWPSLFAYQHILEAQITTLDGDSVEPASFEARTDGEPRP